MWEAKQLYMYMYIVNIPVHVCGFWSIFDIIHICWEHICSLYDKKCWQVFIVVLNVNFYKIIQHGK